MRHHTTIRLNVDVHKHFSYLDAAMGVKLGLDGFSVGIDRYKFLCDPN